MGNPIAHSKSPLIHSLFARQTGEDIRYEAIRVPEDGLASALADFHAGGGRGLNITVPFKQQAWSLMDRRSPAAERAGAVNTITFDENEGMIGDNTDGIGLVRDLTLNHAMHLKGCSLLILGAGGAVRGVLAPLLAEAPASVTLANRTAARARELATVFADLMAIEACGLDALPEQPFDLIVNGTAASLHGEMPDLPDSLVGPRTRVYDMMYGPEPTPFMRWAQSLGAAAAIDGLGMLVEQAAESFHIWRGVRPDTGPVIREVRASL